MPPRHNQHLINGRWVGEPAAERHNPANPAEVVALRADGTPHDVDEAVAAASVARTGWASTPGPQRGAVLLAAGELLSQRLEQVATDLVKEEGKTLAEATGEVNRAAQILRFYGSEGWRLAGKTLPATTANSFIHTRREPLGVVGLVTPWNFPIAIPAWKAAPALIAGNTVILKPSELTGSSAVHLATVLMEAGLPAGVLNIVHGRGASVGEALVSDRRVAALSFTGSKDVGHHIRDVVAPRGARVQLEMGGTNAMYVADDANFERAAGIVAASAFGLTGQACTATSRLLCSEQAWGKLQPHLLEQVARYRPGNGLDEGILMGPVVSPDQWNANRHAVTAAIRRGGEAVVSGLDHEGQDFGPTVLAGLGRDDPALREEIFGPVVSIVTVTGLDDAIDVVNDSDYGLVAGICTSDLHSAFAFAEKAETGVVKVNQATAGLELQVPFGGVKDSSTGTYREQGTEATEFYTWSKSVYMGTSA